MLSFGDWSTEESEDVNGHDLKLLSASGDKLEIAHTLAVAVVPDHYASPEHLARIFDNLGKAGVADFLRTKLPNKVSLRSGDLGEILATEYIDECTAFVAPVKRLRWKDHREMAMRGDDVIGLCAPEQGSPIRFLKTEAKSAATLQTRTVTKARKALDHDGGLPSEHSLSFMSQRLLEMDQPALADAIDLAQLRDGISAVQVQHMVFTFSGNAPDGFLRTDLEDYAGPIVQNAVGLRIVEHQEFIANVYDDVAGSNES